MNVEIDKKRPEKNPIEEVFTTDMNNFYKRKKVKTNTNEYKGILPCIVLKEIQKDI
jgi:hypothetical protein